MHFEPRLESAIETARWLHFNSMYHRPVCVYRITDTELSTKYVSEKTFLIAEPTDKRILFNADWIRMEFKIETHGSTRTETRFNVNQP